MVISLVVIIWLACVIFMLFAGSPLSEPSDVIMMIILGTNIWFCLAGLLLGISATTGLF